MKRYAIYGKYQDYLRTETDNPFWLVNTIKLVRFYAGVDGLKTGYTSEAKFCLRDSKEDNMRVVAVVLVNRITKTRNGQEVASLFDYAVLTIYEFTDIQKGDRSARSMCPKGK